MLLGEALNRCAKIYPNKLALKDEYGKHFFQGYSFTYSELINTVNQLSNSLIDLGLKKGDRVAVQTGTGVGHIIPLLALGKAGMAIAPIDRNFVGEEIAYQILDSGARGFIVDEDIYIQKVEPIRSKLENVEFFIGIGDKKNCNYDFENLIEQGSPEEPNVDVNENDMLTLIYTSGTTGKPKGVPLSHRKWIFSAILWETELGVHPYTKGLAVMPMHTSGGTGMSLVNLIRGASLIVSNPDPEKILTIIEKDKITYTQFSPTLLANVIRHPKAKKTDFSSIESWFTSAAPISATLLREAGSYLGKKFIQLYGTTETALLGTVMRPEEVSLEGSLSKRLTSIGRDSLGYQTKVIDEDGNEVGPGKTGELAIRGDCVAEGYWNKPEADDFRDKWWYSGDVVQIDEDGFYYVVDRKKDMIISGGMNVYPREIENVIDSHPDVNLVAVIGVPDEKWGEAVKAVIVLKEGANTTEDEIINYCKERISSYKKPKSVDFIDMSEMPVSGGGYKILKRELKKKYTKNG